MAGNRFIDLTNTSTTVIKEEGKTKFVHNFPNVFRPGQQVTYVTGVLDFSQRRKYTSTRTFDLDQVILDDIPNWRDILFEFEVSVWIAEDIHGIAKSHITLPNLTDVLNGYEIENQFAKNLQFGNWILNTRYEVHISDVQCRFEYSTLLNSMKLEAGFVIGYLDKNADWSGEVRAPFTIFTSALLTTMKIVNFTYQGDVITPPTPLIHRRYTASKQLRPNETHRAAFSSEPHWQKEVSNVVVGGRYIFARYTNTMTFDGLYNIGLDFLNQPIEEPLNSVLNPTYFHPVSTAANNLSSLLQIELQESTNIYEGDSIANKVVFQTSLDSLQLRGITKVQLEAQNDCFITHLDLSLDQNYLTIAFLNEEGTDSPLIDTAFITARFQIQ